MSYILELIENGPLDTPLTAKELHSQHFSHMSAGTVTQYVSQLARFGVFTTTRSRHNRQAYTLTIEARLKAQKEIKDCGSPNKWVELKLNPPKPTYSLWI